MSPWRLTTLSTLAASALVILARFSERSAPTGPITGVECRIPLDPDVVGSTLVAIRDFSFQPAEIRIKAGGTVTWSTAMTPASRPTRVPPIRGHGAPSLNPGDVLSRTFPNAGTFAYHCEPHPFMTATVIVE